MFHANGKQKKAVVAILILDNIDLKIKKITGDKERCCIIIKGSVQGEDITTVNIYASNIGAPQYIRETPTDIKGELDSIIIVGDCNTPLTPIDRSSKQKIKKETQALNDILNEMGLIDISSGHSIQMQKNTSSSQVNMEHSPGYITSWVTNQIPINLRKLKLYQVSCLTTAL